MKPILFLFLFFIIVVGCSKNRNPSIPYELSGLNLTSINSIPIGVTDRLPNGSPAGGVGILGLFDLSINPEKVSAGLVSLRQTASTDVLESVDLTNFLQMAPCIDCAKIRSISLDTDGNIVLSIGIRHPFGVGDPSKPITGRNRADLHIFNVEGTVVSNLDCTTFDSGTKAANFKLINADGYSDYLDNSLDEIYPTEATIHPYITHFDDYSKGNFDPSNPMGFASVTTPPPSGNLVMAMGCDYDFKDYIFRLDKPVDFIYAVGCTYGLSAPTKSKRFAPEYRIPQFNKKAASEVSIEIISNDLTGGDTTSTAQVEVHVVDISHGIAVGDALDQMKNDSSVGSITIEIPGVIATPINIPGSSSSSGTGHGPLDPLVYPSTIANTTGAVEGTYSGLIKVIDTYSPGQNENTSLYGKDGIKRVDPGLSPMTGLFDITKFQTFQVFTIDVGNPQGNQPICEMMIDPSSPPMPFEGWGAFAFDASGSHDPNGYSLTYEWDFNNDGVFGDPYNAGTSDKPVKIFEFTNQEQVCVKISNGHGGEATCCVDVDIIGYPSKNIPLRTNVEARDIGIDHSNGDLLVLYEDSTVYRYPRTGFYQVGSQISVMTLPNSKVNFIDVAPNGYFYVVGSYTDSDNSVIYFFNPDGTPVSPWPWWGISPDMPNYDVVAMSGGSYQNDACWGFGRFFNSQHETHFLRFRYLEWLGYYDHVYYLPGTNYDGYDKLYYEYIKGCESDKNGNFIWFLENPNYYASRWLLLNSGYLSYLTYDNAYFGTGGQTDSDNGWNDARDITRDNQNRYFVLDELSTVEPRVKVWTVSGNITTSVGSFGNSTTISETPRRIEGSDYESNIVVLHGNSALTGYKISVFFPLEMP